eukprot:SAG31_NODE_4698_length_3026_cov_1.767680_1_plen_90_part_00
MRIPSGTDAQSSRASQLRAILQALDENRPQAERDHAFSSVMRQLPELVAELRREPALPNNWHGCPRWGCGNRRVLGLVRKMNNAVHVSF